MLVGAVFDACRAVSAVKKFNAQLAKDKSQGLRRDEDFAQARFRSRKNPRQTFTVQANCVSDGGIYRTKLGDMLMAERLPVAVNRNICRLTYRHGQYHLAVPYDEERPPERENQARVVALDPGVRSFLTWYCADSVGKIGEGAFFRIQRLCERLDDLLSRAQKSPSRRRRNMRRSAGKMRIRIENLISELHRKAARFLVDEFDVILLPAFETSDMVERGRRRIRSKTVRNLLNLAHYRFGMFLRHKAAEYGVTVLSVNEAYTTRTVSWTGEVLADVGGASVIVGSDGERMDRDYNGARGIYLRALGDTTPPTAFSHSLKDLPARAGRYPRAERLALCVRRERGNAASQRKCEQGCLATSARKLFDVQHSSTNFYRLLTSEPPEHAPVLSLVSTQSDSPDSVWHI